MLLVATAMLRQEFLGDGVRHLTTIGANDIQIGEPRWLLFPVLARLWVRLLSALGVVHGAESSLRALLALCVAAGIAFLGCLLIWLRVECEEPSRRTAALLLAGSCAPSLMLFSDIAEPQLAAALVVAGLAFARIHRDDLQRARFALIGGVERCESVDGSCPQYNNLCVAIDTKTKYWHYLATSPTPWLSVPVVTGVPDACL